MILVVIKLSIVLLQHNGAACMLEMSEEMHVLLCLL